MHEDIHTHARARTHTHTHTGKVKAGDKIVAVFSSDSEKPVFLNGMCMCMFLCYIHTHIHTLFLNGMCVCLCLSPLTHAKKKNICRTDDCGASSSAARHRPDIHQVSAMKRCCCCEQRLP